jgi:hypothetical protein
MALAQKLVETLIGNSGSFGDDLVVRAQMRGLQYRSQGTPSRRSRTIGRSSHGFLIGGVDLQPNDCKSAA